MQLMLPKQLGFATVEIVQVLSDDLVRVKKAFAPKASEALRDQAIKLDAGLISSGIPFKILPYIDQVGFWVPSPCFDLHL